MLNITVEEIGIDQIDLLMQWRMEVLREVFSIPAALDLTGLAAENREYYLQMLDKAGTGHTACFAKLDSGEIVGCGGVCFYREMPSPDNPSGYCAYLMNIYTRKAFRGNGIAQQTVDFLVSAAKKRGITKIYLETSNSARKLYKEIGFTDMPDMMQLK